MDIIYCAGANERLMKIALDSGYLLGVRSDRNDYGFPISFVDIDYKQPDFTAHLEIVKKHRPKYATVPDLSEAEVSEADITRTVKQAEQLAPYCEIVLIVPKLSGQIAMLPNNVTLGYSVPTKYGGIRTIPAWEFIGRRVHLLGGSPHEQMHLAHYMDVMSADGNMAQKIAIQFARYWRDGQWVEHPQRGKGIEDLYLDCWQRSCQNIYRYWIK